MWNSMNIPPAGNELFYVDSQTDRQTSMTKLIVTFRNFSKASKNYSMQNILRVAGILEVIWKVHT
jgi:hypothetical protein